MYNEAQMELARKANELIKEHLPFVDKVQPIFNNNELSALIKFRGIKNDLTKRLKFKIDPETNLIFVNFSNGLNNIKVSYNKIDFSKMSELHFGYLVTESMWDKIEVEDSNLNVKELLNKAYSLVMEQLSAVDTIINSPDMVYYREELKKLYKRESEIEKEKEKLNEENKKIYQNKVNLVQKQNQLYNKLISIAKDF
jgi:hypothetical protein